ncbi:MAG: type II toxin-antitoxin system VapB family antitoxin [Clostridia bacterium]|nr:type II toxin-antitoxin system VapB family antitoxin [Clostridia bacterium]
MSTTIVVDDAIMQRAMELSGLKSKKEVVEQAVLEFVQRRARKDLLDLRGKIQFSDGYDYLAMREGRR